MRDMTVPERVHVMPVGYERDRVVLPARRLGADRVVLLDYDDETEHRSYTDEVAAGLDDAGIEYDFASCDIFDLYDSLGTIADAVTRYEDDDVYVNLASGSKVTAIGGMIACMATGATPYYVRAERYGDRSEGSVSEGVAEIYELPTYPMEHPSAQHVAILDYLAERGSVTKKGLIEYGEGNDLPFIADHDPAGRKGKYRLLDSHVIDPLVENGYVEIDDVGRTKRLSLTTAGQNTLRAFEYLLD